MQHSSVTLLITATSITSIRFPFPRVSPPSPPLTLSRLSLATSCWKQHESRAGVAGREGRGGSVSSEDVQLERNKTKGG
ncbi:hypothetical protein E2C01_025920 [Portunus trituberculatus]|uniref:Uncharacterized protein n=1 Tax=Portunus trituberculatus TaxID=210409 RepID=A0A5B7EEG7_PORTR|nr:hypothetical protein [Portunus trituberculatus]